MLKECSEHTQICFFYKDVEIEGSICDSLEKPPCLMIINHEDLTELAEKQNKACCHLIEETENMPDIKDPALKLAYWNDYKLRGVHYSSTCAEKMEEIRLLASSPVLPSEITSLIYKFIKDVNYNISLIKDVIENCSKEMTERYSTVDEIINFETDWMWNQYNSERRNLGSTSDLILSEINKYLRIKEIMTNSV